MVDTVTFIKCERCNGRGSFDGGEEHCDIAGLIVECPDCKGRGKRHPPNPKWPTKIGYYWARWTVASPATHEGEQLTPASEWEIVEVWRNADDGDEKFGVSVHGVRESQWLYCFLWGEFVADPK